MLLLLLLLSALESSHFTHREPAEQPGPTTTTAATTCRCAGILLPAEAGAATDTYLVNDDPARGPGMPECFLVSDTYR
ncbi:hypothetical protein INR49_029444, partial [Caranx melampygus]